MPYNCFLLLKLLCIFVIIVISDSIHIEHDPLFFCRLVINIPIKICFVTLDKIVCQTIRTLAN